MQGVDGGGDVGGGGESWHDDQLSAAAPSRVLPSPLIRWLTSAWRAWTRSSLIPRESRQARICPIQVIVAGGDGAGQINRLHWAPLPDDNARGRGGARIGLIQGEVMMTGGHASNSYYCLIRSISCSPLPLPPPLSLSEKRCWERQMQRAADAFGRRWSGQLGAEVAAEVGRAG